MLQVACPTCKKAMQVADTALGKTIACPHCKGHLRLPPPAATTPAGLVAPPPPPPPLPTADMEPNFPPPPLMPPPAPPPPPPSFAETQASAQNPLDAFPQLGPLVREFTIWSLPQSVLW